jgi:S-adenosylmethionine:tRNA-ribosyltransferase-isomerase (queuine synthetase)
VASRVNEDQLVTFHLPSERRPQRCRTEGCRLLVTDAAQPDLRHFRLENLPRLLSEGDVLVVNTSGTPDDSKDTQTLFATGSGATVVPWAAQPLSAEVVVDLIVSGILVVPVLLDPQEAASGSSSPAAEVFRVPESTARAIDLARSWGKRVVAVGTSVLRALETASLPDGRVRPCAGTTELVLTPDSSIRVVDGLVTGLHSPRSSHLAIIQAFVGARMLSASYESALQHGYRWGQWGDRHLLFRSAAARNV